MSSEIATILKSVDLNSFPSLISAIQECDQKTELKKEDLNIFFLRNYTLENIEPFLKFHAYQSGLKTNIKFGGYGTFHQEILGGEVANQKTDLVVLTLMLEEMTSSYGMPEWNGKNEKEEIEKIINEVMNLTSATLVVNSFLRPFNFSIGSTQGNHLEVVDVVDEINNFLKNLCKKFGRRVVFIDWNIILSRQGREASLNYRDWYTSKAPFKKSFLNKFSEEINKVLVALKGRSKKCVILDCDNTLWGGILGEDGLQKIQLDRHDYPGKVYYEFQKSLLRLVDRGIILGLCSKNNESDVMEVLENHPNSLIKKKDLAIWKINWDSKLKNLLDIAKELNIGLDSIVFVDDSSFECELINKNAPEVTVLQVPEKLHQYPQLLSESGLFDHLAATAEDLIRTQLYKEEDQRKKSADNFKGVEDYLISLSIKVEIHTAVSSDLDRVSQLTQKTNQFNLTTRRYSVGEIEQIAQSPDSMILTMSVEDKFGQLGLTGVCIIKKINNVAIVDSFLMSCRILGRNLEMAFADHCFKLAKTVWGVSQWQASFIRTEKNQQCKSFWPRFGFRPISIKEREILYELSERDRVVSNISYIKIIEEK
ncbi:MAG: HAD-IIIC family phosphatase [Elusimicrobiota bacterium]